MEKKIWICPRCGKEEEISNNCYINLWRCEECFEKDLKEIEKSNKK